MHRITRAVALAAAATLASAAVTACGDSSGSADDKTITYWATNQSTSLDADKQILQPELDKFTAQTGVKVKVEVVPSTDLLNRILTATTSGKGPDVLNIGNTWSASLQATGAFVAWDKTMLAQVGGESRFLPTALKSTGASGQDPAALPLYASAYELYYNKKLFKAAGIGSPPKTWNEFVADAHKLTKDTNGDGKTDQWGLGLQGASSSFAAHFAFILGTQHGAEVFSGNTPKLDDAAMVDGIDQWVSWIGRDGIVNPSDAETVDKVALLKNLAAGKSAMVLAQASTARTLGQYRKPRRRHPVREVPDQRRGTSDPQQGVRHDPLGHGRHGPGVRHPGADRGPGDPRHPVRAAAADHRGSAVRNPGRQGDERLRGADRDRQAAQPGRDQE